MPSSTKLRQLSTSIDESVQLAESAVKKTDQQARLITKAVRDLDNFLRGTKQTFEELSEFEQEQAKQKVREVVFTIEQFVAKAREMREAVKMLHEVPNDGLTGSRARELYLESVSAENYALTIISLRLVSISIDLEKRGFPRSA